MLSSGFNRRVLSRLVAINAVCDWSLHLAGFQISPSPCRLIRTNPKVNQRCLFRMTMKTRQGLSALTLRKLQICCLESTENSPPASVISSTIGFSRGLWFESINVISALLG